FYTIRSRVEGQYEVHYFGPKVDINGGIKSALDAFKMDVGSYPKGSNGLVELVQQRIGATNWHGPYFDPPKWPVDPWGHKYIYEYPGKHNPDGYDLSSAGPDGKAGTGDDIGNWMN
ncbi:MAG TPA: type II secretion system protein GspG, partial [Verrucomicrobiae bacterium]